MTKKEKITEELLKPFWTEKEKKETERINKRLKSLLKIKKPKEEAEADALFEKFNFDIRQIIDPDTKEPVEESKITPTLKINVAQDLLSTWFNDLRNERAKIFLGVGERYIVSFDGKPEEALREIEKILDKFSFKDFDERTSKYESLLKALGEKNVAGKYIVEEETTDNLYQTFERLATRSYKNYFLFLMSNVSLLFSALERNCKLSNDITYLRKAFSLLDKKATDIYPRTEDFTAETELENFLKVNKLAYQELDLHLHDSQPDFSINHLAIETLDYPIDKIDNDIWGLFADAEKNGQLSLDLRYRTGKGANNEDAYVLFSINFEELEKEIKVSKKLTAFDKRVYIAVAGLYSGGNEVISLTQINKTMGNKGNANKRQREKICNSLKKMESTKITLDSTDEHKILKNYPKFNYYGSLLPLEMVTAEINNILTEGAIHILRTPPMLDFAKGRKQFSTIPLYLLETEVSKTEKTLAIEDYLIERIARIKREANKKGKKRKGYNKIMLNTLFENCNIKGTKESNRAIDTIKIIMKTYTKEPDNGQSPWIKDYKINGDHILITP